MRPARRAWRSPRRRLPRRRAPRGRLPRRRQPHRHRQRSSRRAWAGSMSADRPGGRRTCQQIVRRPLQGPTRRPRLTCRRLPLGPAAPAPPEKRPVSSSSPTSGARRRSGASCSSRLCTHQRHGRPGQVTRPASNRRRARHEARGWTRHPPLRLAPRGRRYRCLYRRILRPAHQRRQRSRSRATRQLARAACRQQYPPLRSTCRTAPPTACPGLRRTTLGTQPSTHATTNAVRVDPVPTRRRRTRRFPRRALLAPRRRMRRRRASRPRLSARRMQLLRRPVARIPGHRCP